MGHYICYSSVVEISYWFVTCMPDASNIVYVTMFLQLSSFGLDLLNFIREVQFLHRVANVCIGSNQFLEQDISTYTSIYMCHFLYLLFCSLFRRGSIQLRRLLKLQIGYQDFQVCLFQKKSCASSCYLCCFFATREILI